MIFTPTKRMMKLGNLPRKKMVKLDFQGFGKNMFFLNRGWLGCEDDAGGLKLKHDARGATGVRFGNTIKITFDPKKGGLGWVEIS